MKRGYRLKIKTPLWTGDIDTKSDLLQTTGIMGSLRWWMEGKSEKFSFHSGIT